MSELIQDSPFMLQAGKQQWQRGWEFGKWRVEKRVYLIFFLSNFNFKVHLILYQLISVTLSDWQPSVLCIWLRCRDALESLMEKALRESEQGKHT